MGLRDLDGFEQIWLGYWLDRAKAMQLTVKPFPDTAEHLLFATFLAFQVAWANSPMCRPLKVPFGI